MRYIHDELGNVTFPVNVATEFSAIENALKQVRPFISSATHGENTSSSYSLGQDSFGEHLGPGEVTAVSNSHVGAGANNATRKARTQQSGRARNN